MVISVVTLFVSVVVAIHGFNFSADGRYRFRFC